MNEAECSIRETALPNCRLLKLVVSEGVTWAEWSCVSCRKGSVMDCSCSARLCRLALDLERASCVSGEIWFVSLAFQLG